MVVAAVKRWRQKRRSWGFPIDTADRAQWARVSAQFLKAIPESELHARARANAEVLGAVKRNYLELFGVKYTARARPQRVLAALERIGETRSAAREALLRLAPVRGAPPIRLKRERATLDDLFGGYPAPNREAVRAFLGASGVETVGELRALMHGPEKSESFVQELNALTGDDWRQRRKRFMYLLDSLDIPLGKGSAREFAAYEGMCKKAKKDRIERDIWGLWFDRDVRVVAVMFLDYEDRRSGDLIPIRMPGTVVLRDGAHVFVRLEGETLPALRASVAAAEAEHDVKLQVPFLKTYAFAYESGCWSVAHVALPDSLGPPNKGAFDQLDGFLSLMREKLQNLVDAYPVGTHVLLQPPNEDGDLDELAERKEAAEPEPAIVTDSVRIAPEPERIGAYPRARACLRARTLRGAPTEVQLNLAIDPNYFALHDIFLALDDMYRRFPVLATHLPGKLPTYFLPLVPDPAALLRAFRERAPPEVASHDLLWQFVDTFI